MANIKFILFKKKILLMKEDNILTTQIIKAQRALLIESTVEAIQKILLSVNKIQCLKIKSIIA